MSANVWVEGTSKYTNERMKSSGANAHTRAGGGGVQVDFSNLCAETAPQRAHELPRFVNRAPARTSERNAPWRSRPMLRRLSFFHRSSCPPEMPPVCVQEGEEMCQLQEGFCSSL